MILHVVVKVLIILYIIFYNLLLRSQYHFKRYINKIFYSPILIPFNFLVSGFSEDVRHGEELNYIMTRSYGGLNTTDLTKYPEVDQTVQQRMITFFTNFAKYL